MERVASADVRIGTAGWAISRATSSSFPGEGRHLKRYARVLGCAEINSSFHRSHRISVYERWAAQTPSQFRFSVKLPRTITHEGELRRAREPLERFLEEVEGLGDRLGVLLVQLPPSLAFNARVARRFFALFRTRFDGAVICEPRHESWFTPSADRALNAFRVGRAGADPARWPAAQQPGGWLGPNGRGEGVVVYQRWHGSPRMYWSRYEASWLRTRAHELLRWPDADRWCIFDNTANGGAIENALALRDCLT